MTPNFPDSAAENRASGSPAAALLECHCVEELDKAIKQQFGERAELELVMTINMKSNRMKAAFPPIYFKRPRLDKAGRPTARMERSHIKPSFCPVCGKAL